MQHQYGGRKLTEFFRGLATELRLIGLFVFLSAALRLLYFFQVRDNPFLNHPRLDALFHDTWALAIASGNVIGDQVFFRAPLYAYLLGLLYWIFGHEYLVVRIVQHLFGVVSVVLVYKLGKEWFGARAGLLAAFLTAVNPMLIYFEGQLLFESLLTILILVWLLLLAGAIKQQRPVYWFFVGAVLGLLAITRPPILAVGLAVLFIAGWKYFWGEKIPRPFRHILALSLGLILVIAPVTIRNYLVGDEFVMIASQGGVNFYIGNNPDADGISSSMPKRFGASWENRHETFYVQQQTGHKPTAAEESAFWYGQAFQFIAQEPVAFLELSFKKLYLYWNRRELPNNLDFDSFKRFSPVLALNPFGFWLFGPFALFGICVVAFESGQARRRTLLLWFVVLQVLLTIVFFVCDRFRLPAVPLLIIFASFGIFYLIDSLRGREYKRFIFSAAAALVFALIVNSSFYSMPATSTAREYFILGIIALNENQDGKALHNFQAAYEIAPHYPGLAYNIGVTEWKRGKIQDAVNWFHRELKMNPGSFNASINLARIYYARNLIDSVEHFASAAMQSKPYLPHGYVWLAKAKMAQARMAAAESVLVQGSAQCDESDFVYGELLLAGIYSTQGRLLDSETRYRSVLSRLIDHGKTPQPLYEPEFEYSTEQKIGEEASVLQAKSWYGLGHVYLSRKNLDSAANFFRAATSVDSEYADAFVDLGVTLLHLRRFNEAETAVSRGVQLNPNHYLYWFNYGNILAVQKKHIEAMRAFEKCLALRPNFLPAKTRLDQIRPMF